MAKDLRVCDLLMKGGITSGVVYPGAVAKLCEVYRFKNIGGTSVGAIAAVATAAAEYCRATSGSDAGFIALEQLPKSLGENDATGKSKLLRMFQPQKITSPLFNVLVAGIGDVEGKIGRILRAALSGYGGHALVGGIIGIGVAVILAAGAFASPTRMSIALVVPPALLLFVLGGAIGILVGIYRTLAFALPKNNFGLCHGHDPEGKSAIQLTDWLTGYINKLAGRAEEGAPLTFGDLRRVGDGDPTKEITLAMMTTNLTHGRPYQLPFRRGEQYWFRVEDFQDLFPETIVNWLIDHQGKRSKPDEHHPVDVPAGYFLLPDDDDLPIVVAARLSLSFPILISGIPLYAVDYSLELKPGQSRALERCWFSDGGICSNFPVHMFDSPIPRWPTFAINLRPYPEGRPNQDIFMPNSNSGGMGAWWNRFDKNKTGISAVFAFADAIKDSMQNWRDNTQLGVPGYRDRVVHVSLNQEEGGLNLNMPPDVIDRLSFRGIKAAEELQYRFTAPNDGSVEMDWANHRWVRFRSTIALVQEMLGKFRDNYQITMPGDVSYPSLIGRSDDVPPSSYRWVTATQRADALLALDKINELLEILITDRTDFGSHAPKPVPVFRIMPDI